jgi:hypothetical protein
MIDHVQKSPNKCSTATRVHSHTETPTGSRS